MIEVHGLTKRYWDTVAVDDLTFEVRPGVVTGFLGPNGAGKSTTMRMARQLIVRLRPEFAVEVIVPAQDDPILAHPVATCRAVSGRWRRAGCAPQPRQRMCAPTPRWASSIRRSVSSETRRPVWMSSRSRAWSRRPCQVARFDHVIVCVGHFAIPNVPQFDGFDSFPGRVLHAHDVRDAQEFTGKDWLTLGSSYSAEDIALQSRKYGASPVTVSYRTAPMGFEWSDGIEGRPLLSKVEDKTALSATVRRVR